ncbi:hypothetical protein TrVE_jg12453 [Triparma verrucosa]|uniref:Uncharacterized protein n=2 Tax=Triparma TaxID=722752 RepID=A0A9W7E4P7_9STRA|nr:hypothetical protein TrST_g5509 [Triparma strigata]GMH87348.1 hypothetical protein TrVE_jg12453 [Triparma verrucosa]|mmetsp:Transcript_25284/g.47505  ORF Transcript_25284/g.47505 Transcript_25284/m.47505 type:complete len:133 (+) Transcript_25284:17-415(+)
MSDEASIPAFLGPSVPVLGNPYSLTKKIYSKVVKPVATPIIPWVAPAVSFGVKIVKPVASPVLNSVGLGEFKELKKDKKGNTTIAVRPEGVTQTIIGGKASEDQEFDVFIARVCETAKGVHKPGFLKKKESE